MALTNERAEMLAKYLEENDTKAKEVMVVSADEAVKMINADGYDFTTEELKEFDMAVQMATAEEGAEFSEDALDEVSGGVINALATIGGAIAACEWAARTGYKIGTWIGKKIYR